MGLPGPVPRPSPNLSRLHARPRPRQAKRRRRLPLRNPRKKRGRRQPSANHRVCDRPDIVGRHRAKTAIQWGFPEAELLKKRCFPSLLCCSFPTPGLRMSLGSVVPSFQSTFQNTAHVPSREIPSRSVGRPVREYPRRRRRWRGTRTVLPSKRACKAASRVQAPICIREPKGRERRSGSRHIPAESSRSL